MSQPKDDSNQNECRLISAIQALMEVGFSSAYLSLFPMVDGELVAFFQDVKTGALYFPVPWRTPFGFSVHNGSTQVVAVPALYGDGNTMKNTWTSCADTNPATMPNTGMLEVAQNSSQRIGGFQSDGELNAFVALDANDPRVDGNGVKADTFELFYREPNPKGTFLGDDGRIGNRPGLIARSAVVFPGMSEESPTQGTGVVYAATATSFGRIKLISRQKASDMFLQATGHFVDSTDPSAWTGHALEDAFPGGVTKVMVDAGSSGSNTMFG